MTFNCEMSLKEKSCILLNRSLLPYLYGWENPKPSLV